MPDALVARLAALPVFEPDPRAAQRLADALRAQAHAPAPRFAQRLWPLAAAAALGAIAVLVVQRPAAPPATVAVADAAIIRAQALEAEVLAARATRTATGDETQWAEAELVRIDQALQAAYDRAAAPDELNRLWRARESALRQVLAAYRAPASAVHI